VLILHLFLNVYPLYLSFKSIYSDNFGGDFRLSAIVKSTLDLWRNLATDNPVMPRPRTSFMKKCFF
jgi:hypothetical protein